MITRIYVDNFRSLVNFEWKPGRVALLMGANGTGKTSVIDALWKVSELVSGIQDAQHLFPAKARARWETRPQLTFEIDVEIDARQYKYKLVVEHDAKTIARLARETLTADGATVIDFSDGKLQQFVEGTPYGPSFAYQTTRSALASLTASEALTRFKDWMTYSLWSIRSDPRAMSADAKQEVNGLSTDLSDFASWLPSRMLQNLRGTVRGIDALRECVAGLQSVQINPGTSRLEWTFAQDDGKPYAVDFEELSDGQRQLCGLYFLRHLSMKPGRTFIFDEPDNYVSLREIQPWLMDVLELAQSEGGPQVWFISHHPELINQLAPGHGVRFFRDNGGPTRIEPFKGVEGLTSAEVVARGWDGE